MCGRFTLASPALDLAQEFGLAEVPDRYQPCYNVAPTQEVAALLLREGRPRIEYLRWGLVPFWAADPGIGNRLINARAETVARKPAFKYAFERRRCLVLADGFYEWKHEDGRKFPFRIRRTSGKPFGMAGLWERWRPRDGQPILSCAIVTTDANALLGPIHERMPVILPPGPRERWLDPAASADELTGLLRPYDSDDLEAYLVSTLVNSPVNDVPACIEPV